MIKMLLTLIILHTFLSAYEISKIDSECYEGINSSCKALEILEKSLNIDSTDLGNDIKYFKEINFKDSRDPGYIILTNNTKWFFGYVGFDNLEEWQENRPLYLIFSKKYGSLIIDKETGVFTSVRPWVTSDDNSDDHILQTIESECIKKSDRLIDWNMCANDLIDNNINEINRIYKELKSISKNNHSKTLIEESKKVWNNFIDVNGELSYNIITSEKASVYTQAYISNKIILPYLNVHVIFLDKLYFKIRE